VACGWTPYTANETCFGCTSYSYSASPTTPSCVCEQGYRQASITIVSGNTTTVSYICTSACPLNARFNLNRGRCVCVEDGYAIQGGQCTKCPNGFRSDGVSCILCPSGSQVSGNTCLCNKQNAYYDCGSNTCLPCSEGEIVKDGVCASCPINNTYSQSKGRCECKNGFTRRNGLCVEACPGGIITGDGTCGFCSPNSYSVNYTICVCEDGYFLNSQRYCVKKCTGCGRFNERYQVCVTCPLNT
jgi:hypothetical protein